MTIKIFLQDIGLQANFGSMIQPAKIASVTAAAGVCQNTKGLLAVQEQKKANSYRGNLCPNSVSPPWRIANWNCYDEIAETSQNKGHKLCHNPRRFSRVSQKTGTPTFCGSKQTKQAPKKVGFSDKIEETYDVENLLMNDGNNRKQEASAEPALTAIQCQERLSASLKSEIDGNQCHTSTRCVLSSKATPSPCQFDKAEPNSSVCPLICDSNHQSLEGPEFSSTEMLQASESVLGASTLAGEGNHWNHCVTWKNDKSLLGLNKATDQPHCASGSQIEKNSICSGTATADIAVITHMGTCKTVSLQCPCSDFA